MRTTTGQDDGTHSQRCAFVPPYLLQRVSETARERRLVADGRETLAVDGQLRALRAAASAATPPLAPDTGGNRVVYDAGGSEDLPGARARDADDPPTGDEAVDEAHHHSGLAWDLFAEVFDRRSVDGEGTPLAVTVHFGRDYDNAFWDGTQLVFGDGDGQVFDRFTKPLDVMAHEFTHGVTQFTAGLTYQGQPGALNESVSDVFASIVKQRVLGQGVEEADWLIGVGLFLPDVQATALRSMLDPGTAYDDPRLGRDPQVGTMDAYVETDEDSGGVHINSGIPNRAFALAARAIGGNSWERAGQVWYAALTGGGVTPSTDFPGFAVATVAAAARLFPDDPSVSEHVSQAWQEVGLLLDAVAPAAVAADVVGAGLGPGVSNAPWDLPTLPRDGGDEVVAVRRTGGFTGITRSAEMNLGLDPTGDELRRLLSQISVSGLAPSEPQPDRFTYTVACRSFELTVPEQDLTPELSRVVQIVLEQQDR